MRIKQILETIICCLGRLERRSCRSPLAGTTPGFATDEADDRVGLRYEKPNWCAPATLRILTHSHSNRLVH